MHTSIYITKCWNFAQCTLNSFVCIVQKRKQDVSELKLSKAEVERRERQRQDETRRELEKVKKRRLEREREREAREEEMVSTYCH